MANIPLSQALGPSFGDELAAAAIDNGVTWTATELTCPDAQAVAIAAVVAAHNPAEPRKAVSPQDFLKLLKNAWIEGVGVALRQAGGETLFRRWWEVLADQTINLRGNKADALLNDMLARAIITDAERQRIRNNRPPL